MIRKATSTDRLRISEIRFAARENRASNPALIESLTDWVFDNSTFWVWEEDGAIQGFSAADPRDGSICALFVHPLYERRGIGRALLSLACDILKESGHATAVLTTETGTRAERFYRTDGWTEVGRKEDGQIILQKSILGSLTSQPALRPARPEDFAYCAGLYFEGMDNFIKELNLNVDAQVAGFHQRWDVAQVRIITLDGADIGWLQSFVKDDALFLGQLFVDGALRGRGIGTGVVKGLIGEAARAGRAVTLGVAGKYEFEIRSGIASFIAN
jgi:GNAT superfamily N-acetyltransferase